MYPEEEASVSYESMYGGNPCAEISLKSNSALSAQDYYEEAVKSAFMLSHFGKVSFEELLQLAQNTYPEKLI